MSNEKNIYQRMNAIMDEVSYVQKENKRVNNQYTFVSHDAVTAALRPFFVKHGVLPIPSYTDISVDGNRVSCSVSLKFVNIDKPDDCIVIDCAGFGHGIDPQDKGPGKAMSYAYKYALLKVFALETGDDPERDHIDHQPRAVNSAPKEKTDQEKYSDAQKYMLSMVDKYNNAKELTALAVIQESESARLLRLQDKYPQLFDHLNLVANNKVEEFEAAAKKAAVV